MSDLLKHPLWQEKDLGAPLPDNEFGVSVCLPLWKHVIGYEEKDPEIVRTTRSPEEVARLLSRLEEKEREKRLARTAQQRATATVGERDW